MAKIVVARNQQAEMERLHPKPVYSRTIILELMVPAGVAAEDYAATPPLGNRVWLLGIDIWLFAITPGDMIGGTIWLSSGLGKTTDTGEIATKWDPIMDMSMVPKKAIWYRGADNKLSFDMMKFYQKQAIRFGIATQNLTVNEWWAICAFKISEG